MQAAQQLDGGAGNIPAVAPIAPTGTTEETAADETQAAATDSGAAEQQPSAADGTQAAATDSGAADQQPSAHLQLGDSGEQQPTGEQEEQSSESVG